MANPVDFGLIFTTVDPMTGEDVVFLLPSTLGLQLTKLSLGSISIKLTAEYLKLYSLSGTLPELAIFSDVKNHLNPFAETRPNLTVAAEVLTYFAAQLNQ